MRSRYSVHPLLVALSVVVVALAVGCDKSTVTSPTSSPSANSNPASVPTPGAGSTGSGGSGMLSVVIKDSPFTEAKAVLVTLSEVSVHMSGTGTSDGEWVKLDFAGDSTPTELTCDLKRLEKAEDLLAKDSLTAGHYTQLRLTVSDAKLYKNLESAGTVACAVEPKDFEPTSSTPVTRGEEPVVVPSGTLKLNREFCVPASGETTITLDFDGDKSIHQTGNGKYMMTPVVGVVKVTGSPCG